MPMAQAQSVNTQALHREEKHLNSGADYTVWLRAQRMRTGLLIVVPEQQHPPHLGAG